MRGDTGKPWTLLGPKRTVSETIGGSNRRGSPLRERLHAQRVEANPIGGLSAVELS